MGEDNFYLEIKAPNGVSVAALELLGRYPKFLAAVFHHHNNWSKRHLSMQSSTGEAGDYALIISDGLFSEWRYLLSPMNENWVLYLRGERRENGQYKEIWTWGTQVKPSDCELVRLFKHTIKNRGFAPF